MCDRREIPWVRYLSENEAQTDLTSNSTSPPGNLILSMSEENNTQIFHSGRDSPLEKKPSAFYKIFELKGTVAHSYLSRNVGTGNPTSVNIILIDDVYQTSRSLVFSKLTVPLDWNEWRSNGKKYTLKEERINLSTDG